MISTEQKERMLLGAVICDGKLAHLLETLPAEAFTGQNKVVFRRIKQLVAEKKPIDPTYIADTAAGIDAAELLAYCVSLSREGATWHAKQYADDLAVVGQKRRLYTLFRRCADELAHGSLQDVIDKCRNGMRELGERRSSIVTMADIAVELYDHMAAAAEGKVSKLPTGLQALDNIVGGFAPGEVVVVGARPAVGKSVFGMAVALAAARMGKSAVVCSCEMSRLQYAQRVASEITGVNSMQIDNAKALTPHQWELVADAVSQMAALGIVFTFDVRTVEELYSVAVSEKDNGMDLLVVDYLQLLETSSHAENDNIRITKVSRRLKQLAMELGIPVVALAQVTRQEGTVDRMPTLSELRGSGSIEQDADKVIFLHRVELPSDGYCRSAETLQRFKSQGDHLMAINVAKNRTGATGWFPARFCPGKMRYYCLTHKEA